MGFGVVVERHHAVPIALEPRRGVGVLPSKAFGELSASFLRFLTGRRVGDLREPSPRFACTVFGSLFSTFRMR